MNKKQKRQRRELVQIGEYLISGGLYFWTGYAVFFVADALLGFSLFWAKMTANLVGWTVNFLVLRFWVFSKSSSNSDQANVTGKYALITLINFFLDYLIVAALKQLGLSPYFGQFMSAGFFTVWNYIWYKTFVFASHIHHRPRKTRAAKKKK